MTDENKKNYEIIKEIWKSYLTREVDLLYAQSYLPLTKDNISIYSPQLLDLILILGSDIENIFKCIGKIFNNTESGNMSEYKENVFTYIADLPNKQFEMYDNNIVVENPFINWDKNNKFELWDIYTKLKHSSEDKTNLSFQEFGNWKFSLSYLNALFLLINVACEKLISEEEHRNQYILKPFSQIFKYKYFGTVEPMNTTFEQNGGTIIIG